MITVTKIFEFDAAHFLPGYDGKCKNMHGHRWQCEIEVSSNALVDGMILDFGIINEWTKKVIDKLDHKLINDIIEIPTAENMLLWIYKYLLNDAIINEVVIERIRLYETPNSFAEWKKE